MPLLYGLALPTGGECGDPRFLVELAEFAEASGWDGVFLEDYVLYQGGRDTPTCDPWAVLTAIALRTARMTLGTLVTPLARRRPWQVARQAAAVDQLGGGRLVLGIGLGDPKGVDFSHFGEEADIRRRAELLDEGLEILVGLWSGKPFSYHGKHYTIEEVTFLPPPVQRPRIPIWIGGGYPNRGPVERALRWDGSCLYKEGGGDISPEEVRQLRERAGNRSWEIAVGGRSRGDDWEQDRAHIAAVAEAGATWWMEYVPPADRDTMRAAVLRGPLRID